MSTKRVIDVVMASMALLCLWPLLILVAILVRFKLGTPVFFRQQRPGLGGVPFMLTKFRTMTDERDGEGNLLPDGERLTGFGRLLRSTSLDELPELFNVLKGDMSIVGPRPLLMRYMPYFTERERLRFTVLPGITGWAGVNGRNTTSWDERCRLDVWYVEHRSLWLDVKIMFLTFSKVLTRSGVLVDAKSTMMLNLDEERAGMPARRTEDDHSPSD
jgi:lipopolysaccharide/colanic/teichoic acid biosynthesis glycosyltransferase